MVDENDYEAERAARIAANRAKMQQLGLPVLADTLNCLQGRNGLALGALATEPTWKRKARKRRQRGGSGSDDGDYGSDYGREVEEDEQSDDDGAGPGPRSRALPPPPTRRSARQRGVEPELPTKLQVLFPSSRKGEGEEDEDEDEEGRRRRQEGQRRVRRELSNAPTAGTEAAKFDSHNMMRLSYMSDDAMRKRINKISNPTKMASLVAILFELQKEELAQMAQDRLEELLQGFS